MQKFILKSKSKEELQVKIKNMVFLGEDEVVEITELKKPRNLFIFSTDGEYEVKIVKKNAHKEVVDKKEIKVNVKKKIEKRLKRIMLKKQKFLKKKKLKILTIKYLKD